jgi:hypothetical protein
MGQIFSSAKMVIGWLGASNSRPLGNDRASSDGPNFSAVDVLADMLVSEVPTDVETGYAPLQHDIVLPANAVAGVYIRLVSDP